MNTVYAEKAPFSNYMTLVPLSLAFPGKLDAFLTSYESLGPLDLQGALQAIGAKVQQGAQNAGVR
ncbi:MAG: hypothetical protein R3D02_03110 [Hyphomicrobiales bacterium]